MLWPYKDSQYEKDLKEIEAGFKKIGNPESQTDFAIAIWGKMRKKLRALMLLARREHLLIKETATGLEGEEPEEVD